MPTSLRPVNPVLHTCCLQVDSTQSSNAQVYRGRFGTGFNTGLVTAAAATYPNPTEQDEQDDNDD